MRYTQREKIRYLRDAKWIMAVLFYHCNCPTAPVSIAVLCLLKVFYLYTYFDDPRKDGSFVKLNRRENFNAFREQLMDIRHQWRIYMIGRVRWPAWFIVMPRHAYAVKKKKKKKKVIIRFAVLSNMTEKKGKKYVVSCTNNTNQSSLKIQKALLMNTRKSLEMWKG